ncbi:putative toxin-antitoxin system toxin component, PIN family [Methylovulum psychrotolerans]|uniref:Putative toxin-antitoxin system toxin component, PIN family n=1 Tax=Methylovulum psychrotolerans TaxID=1704499 RepID=A0A1Z4BUR8_9GAMM|nr:putative toxin-antitoxin system toxin component, PIN family [Methylovulum psychrotolerans]ASF45047.1 putative toxin-antitoxin system toxin component, PIN family [Methylovulum psychrotolerans]
MSHRIVLDTNCIISALLFSKQKLAWLRHSWQNDITALTSKDTAGELVRVLAYPKFKLTKPEQQLLLDEFLPYTETIAITTLPEGLPTIRDQADQKFLVLAVIGQAEALVTGDADILEIQADFHTPPIMTLAEFKAWLEK